MTEPNAADPSRPTPPSDAGPATGSDAVSSTPILRATLRWGGLVGGLVLVAATVVGALVAGPAGAVSGALGALVGVVFPALTAVSILFANRWFGTDAYVQIYFGIVAGAWLLKFLLVFVALFTLSRLEWVVPLVLYFSLIAAAVSAVAVDVVVMLRMRLPHVSDVALPTRVEE